MSTRSSETPWGSILTILTILACLNAWFEPFEGDDDDRPSAGMVATEREPLVRRTGGWRSARDATITPGVQTVTDGAGQCTTNFVFTDKDDNVYLGIAAHCAAVGEELDGCKARTLPLGTKILFTTDTTQYDLGERLGVGTLAYSSWRTMQRRHEKVQPVCDYNDFALVEVDPRHHRRVNPTVPFWGGPTGLNDEGSYGVSQVFGYGHSSLRKIGSPYSRQAGRVVQLDETSGAGWRHTIFAESPGIPGDSGSAWLDDEGKAFGTLSTLSIGAVMWNGLGDLSMELRYARRHSGIDGLRLELGTERFRTHTGRQR